MAITRAFAYNPSQNPIPGTESYGTLVVGSDNLDFSQNPGGIKWWMGPDETDGYVISGVVSGGTQPSPVGDIGTVQFWRTGNLTSEKFISLANKISLQNFTTVGDAVTWLNANGYWTSYDPLLITPTPSATIPLSPTPAVTPTPTVTPSQVQSFLLNSYPGASVAYSLRKLSSTYNGSAIRVRRSSDNAEQDIGFVNNKLDTTTLISFVGGSSGFVTTWYDQSGNGKSAFQSTSSKQPRIVNSGNIEIISGSTGIKFTADFTSLVTNQVVPADSYLSTFIAGRVVYGGSNVDYRYAVSIGTPSLTNNMGIVMRTGGSYLDWVTDDALAWGRGSNTTNGPRIVTNGRPYSNNASENAITSVFLGSGGTGYYVNGISTTNKSLLNGSLDPTNNSNVLTIGTPNPSSFNLFDGILNEIVIYGSNQNSNKTGIESNMNSFYKVY